MITFLHDRILIRKERVRDVLLTSLCPFLFPRNPSVQETLPCISVARNGFKFYLTAMMTTFLFWTLRIGTLAGKKTEQRRQKKYQAILTVKSNFIQINKNILNLFCSSGLNIKMRQAIVPVLKEPTVFCCIQKNKKLELIVINLIESDNGVVNGSDNKRRSILPFTEFLLFANFINI